MWNLPRELSMCFFLTFIFSNWLNAVGDADAIIETQGSIIGCQWAFSAVQKSVNHANIIWSTLLRYKSWNFMDVSWIFHRWATIIFRKENFLSRTSFSHASLAVHNRHDYPWLNWHPWLMHDYPCLSNLIHDKSITMDGSPWTANEWSQESTKIRITFLLG